MLYSSFYYIALLAVGLTIDSPLTVHDTDKESHPLLIYYALKPHCAARRLFLYYTVSRKN